MSKLRTFDSTTKSFSDELAEMDREVRRAWHALYSECFEQGRAAWNATLAKSANPHPPKSRERSAWRDGWRAARRHFISTLKNARRRGNYAAWPLPNSEICRRDPIALARMLSTSTPTGPT